MAEIRFDQVSKRFGDVSAVDNLSFTMADGEFVVLLGPTGAGKTTTLRLVAGLDKPDQGTIFIDDIDVGGLGPAERDLAFVFQQYSLYPNYTVFNNLAFPLRSPVRRVPETDIKERVESIAAMLRIESKLNNKATELSGGEMQRVAIGRALVRDPVCFLMDEPLSSLDAKLREELRVELKRIQQDLGATLLYVTHDQIEAMTMADRIGVLSEGKLIQLGSPREIYTRPATVEVARRLGSPRINLLSPTIVDGDVPGGTETIGIRPEDVQFGSDPHGLVGEVQQIEPLGAETVVLIKFQGQTIHALMSGHVDLKLGMQTPFEIKSEHLIHFDGDGRRLDGPAARNPGAGT